MPRASPEDARVSIGSCCSVSRRFRAAASEDEGVKTRQALDHLGSFGAPVRDALRFVEDEVVGAQLELFVHVVTALRKFVVDILKKEDQSRGRSRRAL